MKRTVILLLGLIVYNTYSQELPEANPENCFYILPIFEHIRVPGRFNDIEREFQVLKMKEQLGEGNLYHRLGFSFIYSPQNDGEVRKYMDLADKHGLHAGLIFALQSHTRNDYRNVAEKDLRQFQWRMDGQDWKGAYTSTGEIEVPEDERDYKIPTNSRYAKNLRQYNHSKTAEWAVSALKLMQDYPGVVTAINGPIEEELAIGGRSNTQKLADYSPYAITEFRDWLRHSGMYDASSGQYAGEGASSLIVGELIDFNGTLRSQFYDDPTPIENNGTGVSFNEFFGTAFRSWSLKYWDLDIFPGPITDENFDCTPEEGEGFCFGGFDAPRSFNINSHFWKAWSYDIPDQGGNYPPGNPDNPAFGFRQTMVRNFVRDMFDVLAEEGLPGDLMYAHQIPGEALGNFTGAGGRNRSSASVVWTGYLEKSETVGITRFGDIDPGLMTQYADDWGIFEWHTSPNTHPQSSELYTKSINALNSYYNNNCHILFPGWWQVEVPIMADIFPLNDSKFAEAISFFMNGREELPYHGKIDPASFTPPVVTDLTAEIGSDSMAVLEWNRKIWPAEVATWTEWDNFSHFEVQTSPDSLNWNESDTTSSVSYSIKAADSALFFRVKAHSKESIMGTWSKVVKAKWDTLVPKLILEAEYDSLYADPGFTNNVVIRLSDSTIKFDADSLQIAVSGNGGILNSVPVEADSIEKFWPMDSDSEVSGIYNVDDLIVKGGVLFGTVSPETPIDPYFTLTGSNLDGSQLPHISFRLFSDLGTTGQLYWFYNGGFSSTTYQLEEGWNTIYLDSLPEWIDKTSINSVRFDPGTTGSARIMLDWFSISSEKLSGETKSIFSTGENEASVLTVPGIEDGKYTINVNYGSISDSVEIVVSTSNRLPVATLSLSNPETVVEKGLTIDVLATAYDIDGAVEKMMLFDEDSLLHSTLSDHLEYSWLPGDTGMYSLRLEVIDNAGDTVKIYSDSIQIFMQSPYSGSPVIIPGIIQAEDYDVGGEMVTYFDNDPENKGNNYRDDAVDIVEISGSAGEYMVDWTETGEWMEYTIELTESIKTRIHLLATMPAGMGEFHFELDNSPLTGRIIVSETEGFESFGTKDIYLPEGLHTLKLFIDDGGFAIDYIEILNYDITGLNQTRENNAVSIYPNPATTEIYIPLKESFSGQIGIYNLSGMNIKTLNIHNQKQIALTVSDLPEGIYFIHMKSNNFNAFRRFVKTR